MGKDQLDEQAEHEQANGVAAALGISRAELDRLDWSLEAHESDDGTLYGYNIHFAKGSDPAILSRIPGLVNESWVRIGPVL